MGTFALTLNEKRSTEDFCVEASNLSVGLFVFF